MKKILIRAISLVLSVSVAAPFTGFAQEKINEKTSEVIAYESYKLADGITYTEEYIVDENSSDQRGFSIDVNSENAFNSIVFLGGENLNTRSYVSKLVNDNSPEEGSIVAAMNGDFFNLSTGLAESLVIFDGVLLTSDRDNYAFAFDKDGKALIGKPAITMPLQTPYGQYSILHYNKEFTEYGLYLYSDCYGEKTRINAPSYELVLVPYSQKLDYERMSALVYGEEGIPFDLVLNRTKEDGTEEIYINERYKDEIDTYAYENGYTLNGLNFYMLCDAQARLGETVNTYVSEIRDNADGVSLEIPDGAFLLCANRNTQIHKLEKVKLMDDISFTFNSDERFIGAEKAIGCGALIVDNGQIVEDTTLSHYTSAQPRTAIGIKEDGSVVMFAVDGRQTKYSKGLTLKQLSREMIRLSCITAANLDGGGSTIVKAALPDTRTFDTVSKPSEGEERKISNAVGFINSLEQTGNTAYSYLKPDNFLLLSNASISLGKAVFTDLNHYGVDTFEKEVNERENNRKEREETVTDDEILKELLDISTSFEEEAEDEQIKFNYLGFTYTVDENKGLVFDGEYKPCGYSGFADILSVSPDGTSNTAFTFRAIDNPDKIEIDGVNPVIYVGDTADASAKAYYKGYEIAGQDKCFEWHSSQMQAFTVDDNGLITAIQGTDKAKLTVSYGETSAEYIFKIKSLPFNDIEKHWAKHNIIQMYDRGISIGELTELGRLYFPDRTFTRNEFCVMLARLLKLTEAVDTVEKTAEGEEDTSENAEKAEYSNESADAENSDSQTIVDETAENESVQTEAEATGTNSDSETQPDTLTNELTEAMHDVVPEVIPEEISEAINPDYADFDAIPVWAAESVKKLYENGYLDGFEHTDADGNKVFDGKENVTRREVIRLIGKFLDDAPNDAEIKLSDITDDDADLINIRKAVHSGIFKGYLDGTLRPDNNLTRAEVSAVFVRLIELI